MTSHSLSPSPSIADGVRHLPAEGSRTLSEAGVADPVLGWDEGGVPPVSEEDVERMVMEALRAGRLDLISALADRLGPERVAELAPDLMERAFATGDEALLEALIRRGLLLRPFSAKSGRNAVATWDNPIRAAVGLGSLPLLQLIVEHCSAALALDQCVSAEGHTLLFDAPSAAVANWLMDHGVDPDHRSAGGATALTYRLSLAPSADSERLAEQSSAVALAERCELSDRVVIALCIELSLDSPEVLRAIVNRGAHPDVTLSTGEPVLVAAASRGFEDSAVYLARHGANPYAITRQGECALDVAIQCGRASLANALNAAFESGQTERATAARLTEFQFSATEQSPRARQ